MKKSIVAASIAVVIGVVWIGASWISGKTIEENKALFITNANEQLTQFIQGVKAQNSDMAFAVPSLELFLQSYDRGLLSSTAKYYLNEPGDKDKSARLYFTAHIEHGPFPLSEVFSFSLAPKAAAIHITLDNTETSQFLFDMAKGQSPLKINIVPGINYTRTELILAPVNYRGIKYNDVVFQIISNNKSSSFESTININSLTVDVSDFYLNIDSLTFNSDIDKGKFIRYPGQYSLKVKSATYDHKQKGYSRLPAVKFEDIKLSAAIGEDEKNIHYDLDAEVGRWQSAGYDLGKLNFASAASGIDGRSTKLLLFSIIAYRHEIEHTPGLLKEVLISNLERLLQSAPKITFGPIRWSNRAGVSQYSAKLQFNQISMANAERLSEDQILAKILHCLHSDLSLSIPMIKEFAVSSIQIAGLGSQADAETQFDKVISDLPLFLTQFDKNQMLKIDGDKVESKLTYADNKVTLNGKDSSLKEFISAIE